jgi:hypothetical protein
MFILKGSYGASSGAKIAVSIRMLIMASPMTGSGRDMNTEITRLDSLYFGGASAIVVAGVVELELDAIC